MPDASGSRHDDGYQRGRDAAAEAILEWALEQRKGFMWVDVAVALARGRSADKPQDTTTTNRWRE